ncbi:MAG: DUF3572 domain-containing protein [Hyphomicrobiales bacterium]
MRFEEIVEELHIKLIVLDDQNRFGHSDTLSPGGPSPYPTGRPLPVGDRLNKPALPKLKVNSKNFSKSSRLPFTEAGERARALALDALLYLAEDKDRLSHFLGETGLDPADLRSAAQDPAFASAMLDYLCSNESLLVAFASSHGIDPSAVDGARQRLAQPQSPDF